MKRNHYKVKGQASNSKGVFAQHTTTKVWYEEHIKDSYKRIFLNDK